MPASSAAVSSPRKLRCPPSGTDVRTEMVSPAAATKWCGLRVHTVQTGRGDLQRIPVAQLIQRSRHLCTEVEVDAVRPVDIQGQGLLPATVHLEIDELHVREPGRQRSFDLLFQLLVRHPYKDPLQNKSGLETHLDTEFASRLLLCCGEV